MFDNNTAVLVLPVQHSPQEFFATEIVARFVFSSAQIFLHCRLRSDSRMIHSRQPKDFEPLHPRAACENVLDRVIQNMAEREHARDVRRRHHDRKRWLRRLRIRDEITIRQPALIPLRFNGIRVVSFGQFSHRDQSSACLWLANSNKRKPEACATLIAPSFSRCNEQPQPDRCF